MEASANPTNTKRADSPRLMAADGLRALCVLIIALYHFWQQSWLELSFNIGARTFTLLPLLRAGYIFVDLMLMLSGFLLYLPYARAKLDGSPCPSTKEFFAKRAARILPGYLLGVFAPLLFFAIPGGEYHGALDIAGDLAPYLTFTQTWFPQTYQHSRLNAVLWTVGIEAQAYMLFPLAAKAFDRRPVVSYTIMTAIGWTYRLTIWRAIPDLTLWVNQLPSFVDVYANGMLAALLFARLHNKWSTAFERALCTLGSCAAMVLIWKIVCLQSSLSWDRAGLHAGQAALRFPLTALGAVWLITTERAFAGFRFIFGNKVWRWMSGVSYAFYIWHQWLAVKLRADWRFPPYQAVENPQFVGEQPWQTLYMITCFVVSLNAAAIVTYLWEQPIANLLRRNKHAR
ncbi:MAG: acyltransferase [Oscillospiraceae bacterium]|jgi:peptidoglycan/LPS O-acetylase OafA/YrhL|nr:acyltransferase [Oscillospiraceae bacterium]